MNDQSDQQIKIDVKSHFMSGQSDPDRNRYVFSYTITIRNVGNTPSQLISRHWIITDADGNQQEVRGDGVVGEQPRIKPGEEYCYTSGAILKTPVGSMYGFYHMITDAGSKFDAPIAPFTLAVPGVLH